MKKDICRSGILVLMLLTVFPAASVETITISSDSGIVWEGLPWSFSPAPKPLYSTSSYQQHGLLAISNIYSRCMGAGTLQPLSYFDGVYGYAINKTVALIPRARGHVTWVNYDGSEGSMTGTIGLPETRGVSSEGGEIIEKDKYRWCLPPHNQSSVGNFYKYDGLRTVTMSGTWVLVANGEQQQQELALPPMYVGSYSWSYYGDEYATIFPTNIRLRISTIKCSVGTPTTIDFGKILRRTQQGAELASITNPLNVQCSGNTAQVKTNINLQLIGTSGLYNGDNSKLALSQGGGYITGEINQGITGSGVCTSNSGVKFDNSPVSLGEIPGGVSDGLFEHSVTWRLCSGGESLPIGKVDASASLVVTIN